MQCEQFNKSSLTGVSALIVEDEKLIAFDVENLLRDFGAVQVWSTGTLSEARRILTGHPYLSVVLLDLKLQDGSGEDLLPDIIARGIPVIITTGYSTYVNTHTPVVYKPYSEKGLLKEMRCIL